MYIKHAIKHAIKSSELGFYWQQSSKYKVESNMYY